VIPLLKVQPRFPLAPSSRLRRSFMARIDGDSPVQTSPLRPSPKPKVPRRLRTLFLPYLLFLFMVFSSFLLFSYLSEAPPQAPKDAFPPFSSYERSCSPSWPHPLAWCGQDPVAVLPRPYTTPFLLFSLSLLPF